MIQFNAVAEQITSRQFRHNADKESALSVYVAFLLHSHTHSRLLIEKFYDLRLCIPYQCILALSSSLGYRVCKLFQQKGFVCPTLLRSNVYKAYAVDNRDHIPSPVQHVILGMAQQY